MERLFQTFFLTSSPHIVTTKQINNPLQSTSFALEIIIKFSLFDIFVYILTFIKQS